MELLSKKIVVVNPPLDLQLPYIDNPAFSFHAPHAVYRELGRIAGSVSLVDSFQNGDIVQKNGAIRFGCGSEELLDRILSSRPQTALIHYSSFQRARGLHQRPLASLTNALVKNGVEVYFADFYDTSTHYLEYPDDILLIVYPALAGSFPGLYPHMMHRPMRRLSFPRFPVEAAGDYVPWLTKAARLGVIKDNERGELVFPYLSSMGCPYNCLFCKQKGESWQGLDPEVVLADLDYLDAAGFQCIHIMDPYANFDVDRFKTILNFCAQRKIFLHFANGVGLKHIDRETAELLSRTTRKVFVSPESPLTSTLNRLGKPFHKTKAIESLDLLVESGCSVHAHFILGVPGESREDINASLKEVTDLAGRLKITPHWQSFVSRDELFTKKPVAKNVYRKFDPAFATDDWLRRAYGSFLLRNRSNNGRGPGSDQSSDFEQKIVINVSYNCNNNCVFCAVGDREKIDGDEKAQIELIRSSYERGVRLLDIDGGEPLLYQKLFTLLRAAREYHTINITTNGRLLSDSTLVQRLSEFSNVKILVSLHSATRGVHNRLTRNESSWRETVQGIENAVSHFSDMGLNTTVTSLNFQDLEAIADFAIEKGIRTLNIQWYTPFGCADRRLFPPRESIESVRSLIASYRDRLRIQLVNFRYCQAPDLYPYMVKDYSKTVRKMMFVDGHIVNLADYLATQRYKESECDSCECALICAGHWKDEENTRQSNFFSRKSRAHIGLLDIIPGYACNRNCLFCTATDEMRAINLRTGDLLRRIDKALERYIPRRARIGGGEPTLRKDLPRLIHYLQTRGIDKITVQTNGLVLCYENVLNRLIHAGMTGLNFSIPAGNPSTLDRLTQVKDSYPLVQRALENALARNVDIEIDILVTLYSLPNLAGMVRDFAKQGIKKINFWHISAEGKAAQLSESLVPRARVAAEVINGIFRGYAEMNLKCYYLPYCFFPNHLDKVWHPAEEDAFVVTPSSSFFLERGQIDIGTHTPRCSPCSLKEQCFGMRKNYLDIYGDSELSPL